MKRLFLINTAAGLLALWTVAAAAVIGIAAVISTCQPRVERFEH